MATIRKRGTRWRAEVRKHGVTQSKTFATKYEADRWAVTLESDIMAGKTGDTPKKTFGALLAHYGAIVSVHKEGAKWEQTRIEAISRHPIANKLIGDLTNADFSAWRDSRLREVAGSTVRREMTLLNHALNISIREWGWLKVNPMAHVKRPPDSLPRDRLISQHEIDLICHTSGYDGQAVSKTAQIAVAFLFAIETAMRMGEIIRLKWSEVDFKARTAYVSKAKNGHPRTVPLSREAMRLLDALPRVTEAVFIIGSSASADALFRKVRDRAGIDGLHFHDTRHEAITRLAKKLDVLPLARMTGHKNLQELMTYYNATASEIAERLD